MQIAICDDSKADTDRLTRLLTQAFANIDALRSSFFELDTYTSPTELMGSRKHYDILFMDIYFPDDNGMTALHQLPWQLASNVIVSSTSTDFALEAFDVNAVHYLTKPVDAHQLQDALIRCLTRIQYSQAAMIQIPAVSGSQYIDAESIIYIEVFNKLSVIHTTDQTLRTYSSLNALSELLPDRLFMRAQRSYLVNMQYISNFYYHRIILHDGTTITLSRNNYSLLKKQYQDYLFQIARTKK